MKLIFRGVRGSIAVPGPKTLRYGGNTTCIEIRGDQGELIILDAGTGLYQLALTLFGELPIEAHLFITHTHWDHIQGLPFFIPTFIPGNTINIYGAFDPVDQKNIRQILSRQLEYCYFPVRESELKATMRYTTLKERQTIQVGSVTVSNILMNHPVLNFGYRIECNGKSIFFTGDHEQLYNIYTPEEEGWAEYQQYVTEKNKAITDFMRGVDLLVADTSYTIQDYPQKKGWGHSTFDANIEMGRMAEVKSIYFTHHEPIRSDDDLERVFQEAIERKNVPTLGPTCHLAREGLCVEL
ncbi:MAG: MBL fold metallo-hydrolase [Magnetococcales bacterium]|nr:MBL fold metallo-hydrolase [Magnetococcales bacterium]MBF0149334.1 MBL fold metallo-hydrolase [Magnetococcales bacterium]MBF0173357.1 MBL fold metallo-hydrolase [Magnetococcales bacterium]MBF0348840.1 MBL fold metallo-hydrolase [Magnetococcales bacterium]MBF0632050.1 MBL fold metallo-hydrolase [Magnetococcales bacterium]